MGLSSRWAKSARISRSLIAAIALFAGVACHRESKRPKGTTVAVRRDSIARDTVGGPAVDTIEVAGEVVNDTAPTTTQRWLFDPNVLSLLSLMNARQKSVAEIELGAWHSEDVRAFAQQMAHDHAVFQLSIDSLAERINMMPIRPALAVQVSGAFQAQIDSMSAARGGSRASADRAFVQQQIAGHDLMLRYIQQLAGVAERPEVRALLGQAATFAKTESARARGMLARLAVPDSQTTGDSTHKRSVRAKRDSTRP